MKLKFLLFVFIHSLDVNAQTPLPLVPAPVSMTMGKGNFILSPQTTIVLEGSNLEKEASFLNDYLMQFYGYSLPVGTKKTNQQSIVLNYERLDQPLPGAYNLHINEKEVYIAGDNAAGVFYGIQTLIQLLPVNPANKQLQVPQLSIEDRPRFAYRGMHLDVARHFFSVKEVKKYIDYLALYKFNNFHWHLTEDQGWRIEIKKYPKLTEVGSCRAQTLSGRYGSDVYDGKKYCGFYTQEEIKEVVQYAADRHINVIPEIDIPGHSLAALSSYPFLGCTKGPYKVMETWGVSNEVLCAGNDSTYRFYEDVLDEIIQLFPSAYIHIGGDECPKERWKTCPVCQQKMKKESLPDEHALQSYFITRIEKYINSKGRKIIGWDEILEGGLAPNATVMSWRGEAGGIAAAKQNHYVIMTPENPLYINHQQSRNEDSVTQGGYNPIENVYQYNPVPSILTEKQAKYILGAQGNMWSEYISNTSKLEYMLFPRMAALAEVLWTPQEKRNWPGFEKRLPGILAQYRFRGLNYSTAFYDLQPAVIRSGDTGIAWKLESRLPDGKIIYVIDSTTNASFTYTQPIEIKQSGLWGAALTDSKNKIISKWTWQSFNLNQASGKKITLRVEPNKSYSAGGAFALVDGIQNNKGMLRSAQFLGFNGNDLEAVIDLGSYKTVDSIILHAFEQKGSWIYAPASVTFFTSIDGKEFNPLKEKPQRSGTKNLEYACRVNSQTRFIKVVAKNYGMIPPGEPGAGNKAWLFADEIEVK